MTKIFLTIALAAATLPLSFAAPQATAPAPKSNTTASTEKPKKHVKKHSKAKKDTAVTTPAPAAPASK